MWDQGYEEILDLRAEAAGSRRFAGSFDHAPSIEDLLKYASSLEEQAVQMESSWCKARPRP